MKTRNVALFALGLVGGFALIKYGKSYQDKKAVTAMQNSIADATKTADCEAQWIVKASTMKFANTQGVANAKATFMKNCLAGTS